ncbi:MAG: FAD-binding protein, partial [Candidatus Eisenbacteria bacterium]|nr:FAD-binding protein [Candidatus Eisenbacteria bacterium]
VSSDENGQTDIEGLLSVGECSCVSVHGSNRLGGNSLLETLVFGKRAGDHAVSSLGTEANAGSVAIGAALARREQSIRDLSDRKGGERQAVIRREMQEVMSNQVGVYREHAALSSAVSALADLKKRYHGVALDSTGSRLNYDLIDTLELDGMLELAHITALGALARTESRGSHWRTDHPARDDKRWMKHTMATRDAAGAPDITYDDVIVTTYKPMERTY